MIGPEDEIHSTKTRVCIYEPTGNFLLDTWRQLYQHGMIKVL